MSTTLHDYTDVEPLTVREISPVLSPIGGEILGFIGPSNREGNTIVCHHNRWPDDDGSQEFYRKLGGYSFNECDLEAIQQSGASLIAIQEVDNSRVLEFDISQYLNGEDGGFVNDRQKLGVPVDEALHEWTMDEATIMKDHQQR